MTRDYVNYKRKKPRTNSKLPFIVIALTAVFLAAGSVAYVYHQRHLDVANLKTEAVDKVSSFFPSLFHRHKNALPAKKVAVVEEPKPLHFDFYDELPKTRIQVPTPAAEKADEIAEAPVAPVHSAPVTPAEKPVMAEAPKSEPVVEKAVESAAYVLQVAIFHSADAANRYRSALNSAGLKIDLVKAKEGNDVVYRLQQGPYHNMDQLKLAKKKLMDRGITCDVRKVTPYT